MNLYKTTLLVENKHGVLAKIATLFDARGYNIDSVSARKTADPSLSKVRMVVEGEKDILEQIRKQLYRLIDVIKVEDFKLINKK